MPSFLNVMSLMRVGHLNTCSRMVTAFGGRCGPVGGDLSLGTVMRFQKPPSTPMCFLNLWLIGLTCELSAVPAIVPSLHLHRLYLTLYGIHSCCCPWLSLWDWRYVLIAKDTAHVGHGLFVLDLTWNPSSCCLASTTPESIMPIAKGVK